MYTQSELHYMAIDCESKGKGCEGARQVNAYNIPKAGNTLSPEILEVLSQPVDRAHDAIRKGHEVESEWYDDWAKAYDVEDMDGKGSLFNVHREACWTEHNVYENEGETGCYKWAIDSGFDADKYHRKVKGLRKAAKATYPEMLDKAGNIRAKAVGIALEQYKSERSDVWLEDKPASVFDDLAF